MDFQPKGLTRHGHSGLRRKIDVEALRKLTIIDEGVSMDSFRRQPGESMPNL